MTKKTVKGNDELQLVHRLKSFYKSSVRPVLDHNDSIIVDLALSLRSIHSVVSIHLFYICKKKSIMHYYGGIKLTAFQLTWVYC